MKKAFTIITSICVSCSSVLLSLTATGNEAHAVEDIDVTAAFVQTVGEAVTTDLKAIEQKLADFVKEKGYDATVTASEEDVAVSFKQQAEGETEYNAAAITQEIKTFCENNALDSSLVKIIFQANASNSTLPQTGYSDIYKAIAGLAALMTVGGAALVVKTRKENE